MLPVKGTQVVSLQFQSLAEKREMLYSIGVGGIEGGLTAYRQLSKRNDFPKF